MAIIISPDGRQKEVSPQNGTDFKLAELTAIVGGHIEIVNLPDGRIMICNEEGKLLELPRNEQATSLVGFPTPEEREARIAEYKQAGIDVLFVGDPNEADWIAGTVLVCENDEVQ